MDANKAFVRSQQKAVKMTLQCVGDALIRAKQVVTLKGFGRVLDGNWHINSAKHVVGPGYKMTLKLTRDGVGAQLGMGATGPDATPDGKVNTGVGPAAADQTPAEYVDSATGAKSWY